MTDVMFNGALSRLPPIKQSKDVLRRSRIEEIRVRETLRRKIQAQVSWHVKRLASEAMVKALGDVCELLEE